MYRSILLFPTSLSLLLFFWGQESTAQEKLKPGRLPSSVRKSLQPGVRVEYLNRQNILLDTHRGRVVGLFAGEAESWTPFVGQRNVKIRLTGYLKLKLKGDYRFSAEGNGAVVLTVNGQQTLQAENDFRGQISESTALVKGYNAISISYSPPEVGDAKFRLYWEGEGFGREPLPPTMLYFSWNEQPGIDPPNGDEHAASNQELMSRHRGWHQGRDLVMSHRCVTCHQGAKMHSVLASQDAPDLAITAQRVQKNWLQEWVLAPHQLRNEVSMPQLLDPQKDKQKAVDLAAYLLSLNKTDDSRLNGAGDADQGGEQFENIGCIACHHFEAPDFEDEYSRISLHFANSKYRKGKLAEFLLDSRKHYQWSRMPQFKLTPREATNLEAFIRTESKGKLANDESVAGDEKRGLKWFTSFGCANCHQQKESTDLKLPEFHTFASLRPGQGCLTENRSESLESTATAVPDFRFQPEELDAINTLLMAKPQEPFKKFNHGYFAARQIDTMRCTSCHDLDNEQANLPYIIEEEGTVGLPPNRVPMLTYVGEKLLPDWSEKLISGELPYRVREHFRVQMPGFPVRGKLIAQGLSQLHGFSRDENQKIELKSENIAKGKQVAAMETGLSCNRCHAIADKKPNAAFDAQSTNLIYAAERLRKEYYLRWMFDPLRIDKQTKMPKFSEDRKTTSLKSIDNGNAETQFEALWQYLNSLKKQE